MQGSFSITINGLSRPVNGERCGATLLDFLRSLGLDSVQAPRGPENPGSDAVLILDVNGAGRPAYRLISSSLYPLPQAAGRTVLTLEGLLEADPPHPVVELLSKHAPLLPREARGAIYLAMLEAWYRYDLDSAGQVAQGYAGFSFRSGGFRRLRGAAAELLERVKEIRAAASADFESGTPEALASLRRRGATEANDPFQDAFSAALAGEAPAVEPIQYVDADGGRFYRAETISELQRLRIEYPEATMVHSGLAILRKRSRDGGPPVCSIASSDIAELRVVLEHAHHLEIGAEAPLTLLEESLAKSFPEFARLIGQIECRSIRNQLTLAEHLLETDRPPVLALPLYLAKAELRTMSSDGEHHVSISGFFRRRGVEADQPNRVLKSVIVPKEALAANPNRLQKIYVFGPGKANRQVLAAAGFAIEIEENGQISQARAAYAGLDKSDPVKRSAELEETVTGHPWTDETLERGVLALAGTGFEAYEDVVGGAEAREWLVTAALRRFYRDHRHFEPKPDEDKFAPLDTGAEAAAPPPPEGLRAVMKGEAKDPDTAAEPEDDSDSKPETKPNPPEKEPNPPEKEPERLPIFTPDSVANIGPKPKPPKSSKSGQTDPDKREQDELPLSFE